jgi:hypothetical protein
MDKVLSGWELSRLCSISYISGLWRAHTTKQQRILQKPGVDFAMRLTSIHAFCCGKKAKTYSSSKANNIITANANHLIIQTRHTRAELVTMTKKAIKGEKEAFVVKLNLMISL